MNAKQLVGEKACDFLSDGMTIGLGTGSTAFYAIQKVGQLVKEGMSIKAVPTSKATEELAQQLNIPLIDVNKVRSIDLTIDGADEFDKNKQLIKGGGGALLREKIIASITKEFICIADYSKKSDFLGSFALPVEVTPFASELTASLLSDLGCLVSFRMNDDKLFLTDNQNYIVDCKFNKIENPESLSFQINSLPGVVENGLFVNIAKKIICTNESGKLEIIE